MKLTESKLKQLIIEVLNEYRITPDLEGFPDDFKMKINSLIDAGEIDQAESLIDALGGDPNYIQNYIKYQEVGDMEKLGSKQHVANKTDGFGASMKVSHDAWLLALKKAEELNDAGYGFDPSLIDARRHAAFMSARAADEKKKKGE